MDKIVRENIEFQRGGRTIAKAIGIGLEEYIKKYWLGEDIEIIEHFAKLLKGKIEDTQYGDFIKIGDINNTEFPIYINIFFPTLEEPPMPEPDEEGYVKWSQNEWIELEKDGDITFGNHYYQTIKLGNIFQNTLEQIVDKLIGIYGQRATDPMDIDQLDDIAIAEGLDFKRNQTNIHKALGVGLEAQWRGLPAFIEQAKNHGFKLAADNLEDEGEDAGDGRVMNLQTWTYDLPDNEKIFVDVFYDKETHDADEKYESLELYVDGPNYDEYYNIGRARDPKFWEEFLKKMNESYEFKRGGRVLPSAVGVGLARWKNWWLSCKAQYNLGSEETFKNHVHQFIREQWRPVFIEETIGMDNIEEFTEGAPIDSTDYILYFSFVLKKYKNAKIFLHLKRDGSLRVLLKNYGDRFEPPTIIGSFEENPVELINNLEDEINKIKKLP